MGSPKLIGTLLAAGLMLASAGSAAAGEGRLERIKDEVKPRDDDHAEGDHRERRDGHRDTRDGGRHADGGGHGSHGGGGHGDWDVGCDPLGDALVMILAVRATLWVLAAPFWGPMEFTGDYSARRPFVFGDYPYADGAAGHARPAWPANRPAGDPDAGPPAEAWQPMEGRADSSSALFSWERHGDGIQGFRGEYQLRTFSRLNLDLSATDYAEEVGGDVEHMGHFKGHVTYSFAVSRHAVFSAGIGARLLSWEDGESAGGWDFRYEAEFFPVRPLHLQAIAEAGWVGDEGAWELEARVGVLFRRLEAFVGYRHFHVAGQDLAGPTAGLMLWF